MSAGIPMRRSIGFLTVALACVACHGPMRASGAAPAMTPDESDAETPGAKIEGLQGLEGSLQTSVRSFYRDRGQGQEDDRALLGGELTAEFDWKNGWTAKARPRFLIDAFDHTFQRFEPLDAYGEYAEDGWSLRFGQFVERWKMAGITSPIDVLNRRDFGVDVLNTGRLGELGAKLSLDLADATALTENDLSFYVIPVFQESGLPSKGSRFAPQSGDVDYDPERSFQPSGPSQALYATRLTSTLESDTVQGDLQLVLARGPEDFPQITVRPTAGDPEFLLVYYGATSAGLGFSLSPADPALSLWKFTGEIVQKRMYAFPGAPLPAPDDSLRSIVGVTRVIPGAIFDEDRLAVTLEYAKETGAHDASSDLRIFGSDVAWRFGWNWNDEAETVLVFRGDHDVSIHETVYELSFQRDLSTIGAGARFFSNVQIYHLSDRTSLFSLFPTNNSSVELGVSVRF